MCPSEMWEDELKREVNRLLKEENQPPVWAEEWEELDKDQRDAFGDVEAEDLVVTILAHRNWPGPRPRHRRGEAVQEVWTVKNPEHWSIMWRQEMAQYEPTQRSALHALGWIAPVGATFPPNSSDRRPLGTEDFIPEEELRAVVTARSAPFKDGETDVLEWVVPRSREHPNGVDGVAFRWGYWRKDLSTSRTRIDDNPLYRVRRLAEQIAAKTFLPLSEIVSFLLCNRSPEPPWIRAVIREAPGSLCSGQERMLLTLEIRDPLLASPQEVERFYSYVKHSLFGERACNHPWRQRMVNFVKHFDDAHAYDKKVPTWDGLMTAWNTLYPNHPYSSWRSMRQSYLLSEQGRDKRADDETLNAKAYNMLTRSGLTAGVRNKKSAH